MNQGLQSQACESPMAVTAPPAVGRTGHEHDWDWLVGRWSVQHRRLQGRLEGSTRWETFPGTVMAWLTLDGLGIVDNNLLEDPGGSYRAMSIRAFDTKTGLWSIWWLDGRNGGELGSPVRGGFNGGIGIFDGADTLEGRPVMVRFRWSMITPVSALWEQAFSPDDGVSWETNWTMEFSRTTL